MKKVGTKIISPPEVLNHPSKGCILSDRGLKTLIGVTFPPGITTLDVSYNDLENLQGCPSDITHLFCYNNQLTDFDGAPKSLIHIDAHSNPITSSKGLENCPNVKDVCMYMCDLKEVNGFPNTICILNVAKNKITSIINLPSSCKEFLYTTNPLPDEFLNKTVDELRALIY